MFKIGPLGDVSEREIASLILAIGFWGTLVVEVALHHEPLPIILLTQASLSIVVYCIWLAFGRASGKLSVTLAAVFFASEAAFLAGAGVLAGEGSSVGIAVAALKGLQVVIENISFIDKGRETSGMYLPTYNALM